MILRQLTTIMVLRDWTGSDGSTPNGDVEFTLTAAMTNEDTGESVPQTKVPAELVNGAIAQSLVANDQTVPATLYEVVENISGATVRSYYISVPSEPPGSRQLSDAVTTQGDLTLESDSGDFTDDDIGSYLFAPGIFATGTQILTVVDSENVTVSTGALTTGTGGSVLVGAQVQLASLDTTV